MPRLMNLAWTLKEHFVGLGHLIPTSKHHQCSRWILATLFDAYGDASYTSTTLLRVHAIDPDHIILLEQVKQWKFERCK